MTSDDLEKPFKDLQGSEALIYQVFRVFSRFEFALKRSGFVTQERNQLIIDRHKFVRECSQPLPTPLPDELQYLVDNPPRRQKLENNSLVWQEIIPSPTPLTFKWLLDAAYTVRNNLFHGGKWTSEIEEPARDEKLLQAALAVIKLAIERNETVKFHYTDSI